MKARICGLFAVLVALMVLALPMRVWAHDDDDENEGWEEHHDHGLHRGWYKHHHHEPDAGDYGEGSYYNQPYVGGCAAQPGINYGHLPRQRSSLLTEMNNNYGRYETALRNGNYSRANFLRERLANEQYRLHGIDSMLNCPPGAAYPSNYPAPSIYGGPSYGAAGYGEPYGAAGYGAPYGAAGTPYGAAGGTPDLGSLIGSLSQYMGNGASPYAGQYPPSSNSPYPGQYPAGGSYSPYGGQYPASGGASSLAAIAQMLGY